MIPELCKYNFPLFIIYHKLKNHLKFNTMNTLIFRIFSYFYSTLYLQLSFIVSLDYHVNLIFFYTFPLIFCTFLTKIAPSDIPF